MRADIDLAAIWTTTMLRFVAESFRQNLLRGGWTDQHDQG